MSPGPGAGTGWSVDRRHWPRKALSLLVQFGRQRGANGGALRWTGRSRDISPGGVYLTTQEGGGVMPGEALTVSISVPWELRRHFPFSRIMGPCRVVRADKVSAGERKEDGLALAFCAHGGLTLLGAALTPR